MYQHNRIIENVKYEVINVICSVLILFISFVVLSYYKNQEIINSILSSLGNVVIISVSGVYCYMVQMKNVKKEQYPSTFEKQITDTLQSISGFLFIYSVSSLIGGLLILVTQVSNNIVIHSLHYVNDIISLIMIFVLGQGLYV